MTYTCFDVSKKDGIAHVVLKRGEALNTMTRDFWRELPEIMYALNNDGDARVCVISSTGRHFSAGMDLANFSSGQHASDTKEDGSRHAEMQRIITMRLQESMSSLEKVRMPVLVAIQGGCIGGAVDMTTAADMRFATEDAWFCVQEINIGLAADVGTLQRLPRLIPVGIARQLCYTGERLSAQQAMELGLVNKLYPTQEAMLEGVMEIAHTIASKSPLAVASTKHLLNHAQNHSVEESLEYTALWNSAMLSGADLAAGMKGVLEKQPPEYQDLKQLREYWDTGTN